MASFRKVVVAAKNLPTVFVSVASFMKDCIDAGWAGYMQSECMCFDNSSTIRGQSTFRLGASWVSQHNDDIANLQDLED